MMTFDEWWKANSYKFGQADHGGGYDEVARAAWDAATEQEREHCDEIRDSEARDADR